MDPKLLALVTAVAFGMSPVALKLAYRYGGQTSSGMVIGLVAAIPLNLALIPFVHAGWELLTPGAWVGFIGGGLAGAAIGRRFIYESINLLGPSRAATIRSVSPMLTAFAAVLLYQEEITPLRWAAIISIVGGAALVSWTPGSGARGWLAIGVLYALGAAAAYGIRPLFLKFALDQADAPLAGSIIGAFAALLWALAADRPRLGALRLDRSFFWFTFGGITQTTALLALTFGLNEGDVSLVYSLTAAAPLFTLAFTAVFLRGVEQMTLRLVLGAIAVVAGVIIL
jgi:drug/metabolite transporter (DMT)-like permease